MYTGIRKSQSKYSSGSLPSYSVFFLVIGFVSSVMLAEFAQAGALDPTAPTSMNYIGNYSAGSSSGTIQNHSRGYIHIMNLNQSQTSQKWKAYVGNISGEYALQDANGYAIYDWDIATVTGEIYATRESTSNIPNWTSMVCANHGNISKESVILNHSNTDEDSYNRTWKAGTGTSFNHSAFYVGTKAISANTCYGVNLNQDNTDQGVNWTEVVLMDGTKQDMGSGNYEYDIIYASLIENSTAGFNGNELDYQIILPESGLEGTQSSIAYYFYVELI